MREIKFKGLRIDTKEWVYGFLIIKEEPIVDELGVQYNVQGEVELRDNYYIYNEDDERELKNNFIQVIPESVGQFTGRKDRDGKEIYEWDNVKRLGGIEPTFKVIFDINRCGFVYKRDGDILRFLFDYSKDEIIVIGNTYQNKEE